MDHAALRLFETTPPRALDAPEFEAVVHACGDRRHGCLVLDVRGALEGRPPTSAVCGSAWVPFDAGGRPPVWLMPARGRELVVVGDRAPEMAALCSELGWPAWWFAGTLESRWLRPGAPDGALWNVDPLLRAQLPLLPPAEAGRVLDLGAGSSREGVFLAQAGYRVLAVDHLPDALDLARRRAAHHGVAIETLARRVGRGEDLPTGPFAAVLLFRFCERQVLAELGRVMLPGGVVLLRTFGQGEGGSPPPTASRGPRRAGRRIVPEDVRNLLGTAWDFIDGPRTEVEGQALWTVVAARWTGQ